MVMGPRPMVNSFEGDATRLASPTRASAVVATESPVGVAVIVQAREATELASTALAAVRVHDTSPTVIASAAVAGAPSAESRTKTAPKASFRRVILWLVQWSF